MHTLRDSKGTDVFRWSTRWPQLHLRSCPRCTIGAVEVDRQGPSCTWCGWAGPVRWEPLHPTNGVR